MGQRIIGLTGGIATGKSTVSQYVEQQHGIPVLDADIFARQAVEPGSDSLAAIVERYGPALLTADGSLDRSQLGQIIFNDSQEKTWVEQQIHPFVRRRFAEEMAALADQPTVVQAIPLLFEANLTHQVTEIWVVTCPEPMQLARLQARNRLSAAAAQVRINNQWPLSQKVERADVVLVNDSTIAALYVQVDRALASEQLYQSGQRQGLLPPDACP